MAVKLMMAFSTTDTGVYVLVFMNSSILPPVFPLFRPSILTSMELTFMGINRDYIPLVNLIAIYFQIRDDSHTNLTSEDVSCFALFWFLAIHLTNLDYIRPPFSDWT